MSDIFMSINGGLDSHARNTRSVRGLSMPLVDEKPQSQDSV